MRGILTKIFMVVAAVAILLGTGIQAAETKGKIGMTCMDLTNPFFKLIGVTMQKEAAKYGYDVVLLDGANDAAKQNSQMNDFVAQKFDAIFLNPADSKAAGEGVKKAYAAGIHCIHLRCSGHR